MQQNYQRTAVDQAELQDRVDRRAFPTCSALEYLAGLQRTGERRENDVKMIIQNFMDGITIKRGPFTDDQKFLLKIELRAASLRGMTLEEYRPDLYELLTGRR